MKPEFRFIRTAIFCLIVCIFCITTLGFDHSVLGTWVTIISIFAACVAFALCLLDLYFKKKGGYELDK